MDFSKTLENYNPKEITIAVLGGHSALDVCEGAKRLGFQTLVVCQKGREKTYEKYYRTRGEKGCIDHIILVDNFADVVKPSVQEELLQLNSIFIHNRYFWVYCNFDEIEKDFKVPIYGSREMVRLEERDVEHNQYWLLEQAGIRIPKMYTSPEDIDGPVIVKVNEAQRSYERAFFVATSPEDYEQKSKSMMAAGTINQEGLDKAVIEEFIIGAQVNFNFFIP